ncbi:MAG TPA: alpha/beta hydrolase [Burkholderiales bacterium]|jgi:pimeloyl-ACP methyl ester carboxylesterase
MALAPPVIVVPGITASSLRDEYPLPPETVWSVLTKDYSRVALHPDNTRYEVVEPAHLRPDQLLEIAYRELIEELRFNLTAREDEPVPVYPFAYDWRQPLDAVEEQLAEFVDEVIERTSLARHYHAAGYSKRPRVNLVGHSMGGLIITGYLARRGKKARVGKVATLATPFRGSFEAVIKIATGTANLGSDAPSSREREAARVTPALYHLLPSCPGLDIGPGCSGGDLFDPRPWQPSILKTLEEYVRLYGRSPQDGAKQALALFRAMLETAKQHRRRIDGFKPGAAGLAPADWLCVVGVGSTTRVRLKVRASDTGPDFELSSGDRENRWTSGKTPKERRQTGDGTVPFEGALPRFLPEESIVCVTPDDFKYWEIQDRVVTGVAGFHGILPNMDMLHRLIVRHFTGRADARGNTWGQPAPGVRSWRPPLPLRRK